MQDARFSLHFSDFLFSPGRIFYSGAVCAGDGFAVATGEVDVVAFVHETIDLASVVFEEVFYFVVVIIGGGFF